MLQNSPTGAVAAAQPAQRLGRPLPRGVEAAAEEVESSEAGRAVLRTLDGGRGWELAIQEFWTCAALSLKILPLTSMPMRCKTWPQLLFSLYAQCLAVQERRRRLLWPRCECPPLLPRVLLAPVLGVYLLHGVKDGLRRSTACNGKHPLPVRMHALYCLRSTCSAWIG